MGGTPVFPGSRVPVQTLLVYIEAGDTIDEFLIGFPSLTREQVTDTCLSRPPDRTSEPTVGSVFGNLSGDTLRIPRDS